MTLRSFYRPHTLTQHTQGHRNTQVLLNSHLIEKPPKGGYEKNFVL